MAQSRFVLQMAFRPCCKQDRLRRGMVAPRGRACCERGKLAHQDGYLVRILANSIPPDNHRSRCQAPRGSKEMKHGASPAAAPLRQP